MTRGRFSSEPQIPKHRQVFESLLGEILSGKYKDGQKFPSEAALVQQFQTSRITIGRALRDLTGRGLLERIAGSGTYVRRAPVPAGGLIFGLLIADLGHTEIFEPICSGIAASSQASHHALLWGHTSSGRGPAATQALEVCSQFLERKVAGVFFAPIERAPNVQQLNLEILRRLEEARVPVILLDRCVLPYPNRSCHDLVGIDNRRAGYMATQYLLKLGVKRVSFLAYSGGAPTIDARLAGFREALFANDRILDAAAVHRLDAINDATIRPLMKGRNHPNAFVCANDRTAGQLMQALQSIGYRVPRDVRIVGMDDVEYASLLPVPLTTVHQPCREIGEAAMDAMLDRINQPGMPVRDILLESKLVIRESCGAKIRA